MPSDAQRDSDNLPNDSEDFGKIPQPSEAFRSVPNDAEARGRHTLTVREVARMFEDAGVARTERSITNWCRQDVSGSSRLNCRFDHNERKYFITPESVERAIQEELAKGGASGPKELSPTPRSKQPAGETGARIEELQLEIRDLEITNRAKDMFIEQLREDRANIAGERQTLVERLAESSRVVGKLEEKLHRLEAPSGPAPPQSEAA